MLTGPDHAAAGTQRLERVLQHKGWQSKHIEQVMWNQAEHFQHQMEKQGETVLCIWDSSVIEKPESQQMEGLSKVRSSRVRRLARTRPGVYNRPGLPVSVRGFEWEGVLLAGMHGLPQIATMQWWSKESEEKGKRFQVQSTMLQQIAGRLGRKVRHVFDRGYGHGSWLAELWKHRQRFVVRWKKGNKLIDAAGQERKAWEIARGKRSWGPAKLLWDTHFHLYRSTNVLALPVSHPRHPGSLWLVVVRQGKGREPWYVLTNEPVETPEQAWDIAFTYVRRWKIEESFRFQKTELLIETIRVQDWEPRRKLLWLVALAYGFLLSLLQPQLAPPRTKLFSHWCQRADWRMQTVKAPLYRLRWALSRLWMRYPPRFLGWRPYRHHSHITWPICSFPWWTTLWHQIGYTF